MPSDDYHRAIRATTPADVALLALEIHHPAAPPIRVVNDVVNRMISGHEYTALRFDAQLSDDVDGRVPQAEIIVDNIGREIMQWIDRASGGVGATVRVMQILATPDPAIEWEMTLDVARVRADQERITVTLGYDPLLGRAAVSLRHDSQTSPGLF